MEDAKARLLDAVERLCLEQSPSQVSMRAVATEAGVSVGLAYYHFASKDDLFGTALDRMASEIAERTSGTPVERPLLGLLEALRNRPAFARLITALVLDRKDVSALMSGHPLMQQVAAKARAAGSNEAESFAGIVAMLSLAQATYGPALNRALGRSADDTRLAEALAGMLDVSSRALADEGGLGEAHTVG